MDKRSNHIKNALDSTFFKEITFKTSQKYYILNRIRNNDKQTTRSNFRLNRALSISVYLFLIFSMGMIVAEKITPDPSNIAKKIEPKPTSPDSATEQKNDNIYTPPQQDEYFEEMTKEEILTKMLNSVDHFETAKGEFELYYANSNTKINVQYELSIRENSGGIVTSEYEVNGEKNKRMYSYKDVYTPSPSLKIEDAFSININGEQVTDSRWRPPIQEASNSLFPYEIASNYTRNLADWEIEKQDEQLLDHNTMILKGNLNPYAAEKGRANSFRFWIDKDSGVLIKYETYNRSGEIVDYLHPLTIKINTSVNVDKFHNDAG
jgi:outer membrane lipoprotein-sorting protein